MFSGLVFYLSPNGCYTANHKQKGLLLVVELVQIFRDRLSRIYGLIVMLVADITHLR